MEANFIKSLGWVVGAVTHAAESDDELLQELADELRGCYQLMAEDLGDAGVKLGAERFCVLKHLSASVMNDIETIAKRKRKGKSSEKLSSALTLKGKIIQKIIDESMVEE